MTSTTHSLNISGFIFSVPDKIYIWSLASSIYSICINLHLFCSLRQGRLSNLLQKLPHEAFILRQQRCTVQRLYGRFKEVCSCYCQTCRWVATRGPFSQMFLGRPLKCASFASPDGATMHFEKENVLNQLAVSIKPLILLLNRPTKMQQHEML